MAETYFPFAAVPVYQAQWSSMLKSVISDGAALAADLLPFGDSTGMQVKVPAGSGWVQGFFYNNSATKVLAIGANSSGNPRIDLVVLSCDEVAGTITAIILAGTPAPSPVAPALTQVVGGTWQISLASVAVANGAATITAGNVTDTRTFAAARSTLGTPQEATIAANESTVSASYVDLSTPGPAVTVTISGSGLAIVTLTAGMFNGTVNNGNAMGVALTGANTVVAVDTRSLQFASAVANQQGGPFSVRRLVTGLTPGVTTFTAKYKSLSGGTASFNARSILVEPL